MLPSLLLRSPHLTQKTFSSGGGLELPERHLGERTGRQCALLGLCFGHSRCLLLRPAHRLTPMMTLPFQHLARSAARRSSTSPRLSPTRIYCMLPAPLWQHECGSGSGYVPAWRSTSPWHCRHLLGVGTKKQSCRARRSTASRLITPNALISFRKIFFWSWRKGWACTAQ